MPASSYLICATPRSGSTLLCDLLKATGVAGAPNSFYRELSLDDWISDWGVTEPVGSPDFDRVYLDAALKVGCDETPVFGMRTMWNSMDTMFARLQAVFPEARDDMALLEAAFGAPGFIHLSRQDKVGQAISRYRAERGGLWHLNADGTERERTKSAPKVEYDRDGIAAFLTEVEADERHWQGWFAANRITPLDITYEELSDDPAAVIAHVLTHIGVDPTPARFVQPRTRKLANDESWDWAERFLKSRW